MKTWFWLAFCLWGDLPLQAAAPDPRGPIEYPGMTVVVNDDGVRALGYSFHNDCAKPGPWQARWIWAAGADHAPVALFRQEFTLTNAPRHVAAWLTADTKYRLYVNGRLVSRGPVDMGRDYAGGNTHRWFYDARDLTAHFHQGTNVVAAEVFREWPVGATESRGQPGLLFEASVALTNGQTITLKSDAEWRGLAAPQFRDVTTYDAAAEPPGWRLAGFDDHAWPACREIKDIWAPLVPSEIPPLMEARYPVMRFDGLGVIQVTKDTTFRVVFDRVLSGYPTVRIRGGKGARLTLKAHRSATVLLGDGLQSFEFPFLTEIAPGYTVEVKNVTTPLEVLSAGATFTSQPVNYLGAFACSDPRLNRIWMASRWAVQICLQTHHLDSPNHQEPICDPGDYVIESMVNHYAFGQPWLARQDIRKFAWLLQDEHYRNFHTSYSIGWLQMLMDYYDFTGDRSLVDEMAPYAHELLDTYASWRGTNGIISEAPNYMFMDWVDIGGFGCHHPPAVIGQGYLTAFYAHGLTMGSRMARVMGNEDRARAYEERRRDLVAAFNRELWVPAKGLYRDGRPFQTSVKPYEWLPADKDLETFSPHVNLLAVLYDLAPKERQRAIVEEVMSTRPLNTQPWFMHWVFQALDHAGLFDRYGVSQMHRWQVVPETESFREMWKGGDLSHGWCSTPLVQMSSRILGVTPAEAGFRRIRIRPELCGLAWARGRVPTPLGPVSVSWKLEGDKLGLDVVIPEGGRAELELPAANFEAPAVVYAGRPSEAVVEVGPGAHHFEVTGKLKPRSSPPVAEEESAPGECDAYEKEIVKDDLVHRFLAKAEDHATHPGGGSDPKALLNGTSRNGSGGSETADDGKTFRGYGAGDWLVLRFKKPCAVTEIRSFAGHPDGRASQASSVLAEYASAPGKFEKLTSGAKTCSGGASELQLKVNAPGVIALRFEFADGPLGFNVYREINVIGQ